MRVLIAEDEWILADTLAVQLEEEGARIAGPCPTTEGAVNLLNEGTVDFAIVDMNLKDSFSDPLVELLVLLDIPFVILTAFTSLPTNSDGSAVRVLHKPADHKTLIGILSAYAVGGRFRGLN